jgi:hypothetical protein
MKARLCFTAALFPLLFGCTWFTTTTTYSCNGETGCCCNSPMQHSNPGAGNWPDCGTGYQCVGMQPGGVLHPDPAIGRIDVNVCQRVGAPLTAAPQVASTQPSFCRTDLVP